MTCDHCGGLGIAIQEWTDAPPDFAVCICPASQAFRSAENNGHQAPPMWQLWCARWQIDPARVFMLEDIYTAQELAAAGISKPAADLSIEAALLKAARQRK